MLLIAIVAKVHALGSFQSIVTSVVTSNHNQYHHQYHHQTRRLRLRRCRLCCFRDRPLDAGIESNERNPPYLEQQQVLKERIVTGCHFVCLHSNGLVR